MHRVEGFLDALVAGEAAEHLAEDAVVDDPRAGRVQGRDALARWGRGAGAWLARLRGRVEPVRLTEAGKSAVMESLLQVKVARERRPLPVAVAAEADRKGLLRSVRIYHSFWSLEHGHRLRARILPARRLPLAPPVDAYQRALAEGDVDRVLACYERNASVREPAGEPWVHKGPRGLRRLYGTMFANGGGVTLEHGNAVDDGVACALEYTVVRWGRTEVAPQAGLTVYERGPTGRIGATRIYDDVEPPRD
jgi:ketosteroid isomerase-like protein